MKLMQGNMLNNITWHRLSVKKGASASKKLGKKAKAIKDLNKPKRPASAFFVFMKRLLFKLKLIRERLTTRKTLRLMRRNWWRHPGGFSMVVLTNGSMEGSLPEDLVKLLLSPATNWGDIIDVSNLKVV